MYIFEALYDLPFTYLLKKHFNSFLIYMNLWTNIGQNSWHTKNSYNKLTFQVDNKSGSRTKKVSTIYMYPFRILFIVSLCICVWIRFNDSVLQTVCRCTWFTCGAFLVFSSALGQYCGCIILPLIPVLEIYRGL